jgi:arsenate reductase (glutaredoxin)
VGENAGQAKKLEALSRRQYHASPGQCHLRKDLTMDIKIFHNSRCGTSRTTLGLIRDAGHEPEVIDYLAAPPAREELREMIARAGLSVREAVRSKEALYGELGLDAPGVDDEALLDAMVANPILINRPFVITPKGVRLCRPSDLVNEIL